MNETTIDSQAMEPTGTSPRLTAEIDVDRERQSVPPGKQSANDEEEEDNREGLQDGPGSHAYRIHDGLISDLSRTH